MKINEIKEMKVFESGSLTKCEVKIEFDTANPSDKPDGDALYYLICALDKCKGKSFNNLDIMEKSKVQNRLEAAYYKIKDLLKELDK